MWRTGIAIIALAAACTTTPATFDIASLKPTAEGEQTTLTGRFELTDGGFRLYPGNGACLSGTLLSTSGNPTPEFSNREMTVSGYLVRAGSPEAGSAPDVCKTGLIMQATDIAVP